jgi:hypothetical protein
MEWEVHLASSGVILLLRQGVPIPVDVNNWASVDFTSQYAHVKPLNMQQLFL